jgi:hypothetical protein
MLFHDRIYQHIAPTRERLLQHPLYRRVQTLSSIRVFMETHVFAVWDFMSLLKRLQRDLTCVAVPWVPVGSAEVRHLINEIVCSEESDVDGHGERRSHFEMYLDAMGDVGASTVAIRGVLEALRAGATPSAALEAAPLPPGARAFSASSLRIASNAGIHEVAAAFTYGREDVIPEMFAPLVQGLVASGEVRLERLGYYLRRHIEVDGGRHGAMARRMTGSLCGDDPLRWLQAAAAAQASLEARIALWDALLPRVGCLRVRDHQSQLAPNIET